MWPESDQTEELLHAARGGDREAVNHLLGRHRDALRRMVEMRLDQKIQRRVGVSDIVQEVMVDANRRLQEYLQNPGMPFHLWLRHMARDRIIDAHRRHRASAKRSVDREKPLAFKPDDRSTMELAGQLYDPQMTPQEAATVQELAKRFQAAIEQLDEHDREVILMRHFEHLTNQEVAQALSLSEPAASMRYLRAIRRLRELLGDEAVGS